MDHYSVIVSACLAVITGIYAVRWYTNPLRAIPTVCGSSLPGLSYLGALRMLGDCRDLLEAGYRKYPDSAFKVALLDKWLVVVTGRNMVEELRKRGEKELASPDGAQEMLQMKYIFEPSIVVDRYHSEGLKEKLAQRHQTLLSAVVEEVSLAVKGHVAASENAWTSIEVLPVMQKIVARASNRAFVGLPLCRNEDFLALAVDFAVDFMKSSVIIRLFPRFLKPIIAFFVNFVKHDTARAALYLRPVIEERRRSMAELGEEWNGKPSDLLQSILDNATAKHESAFIITQRLFTLNFAAIHTSSNTVTHALYRLAEKPELVASLREEIATRIAADGWTSTALGNMWKLDSLLRETLRYHGIALFGMTRKVMRDITLHDGTRIPKGTLVSVLSYPMHHDNALLENADTFDAFRFARMRAVEGQSAKYQFTSTSPEYIPFGHGYGSCPGRYFASNQLKTILAYIILHYDMKLGGDGSRPPDVCIATGILPALGGRILFKQRERSA